MKTYNWKNLSDEQKQAVIDRFHEEGDMIVGSPKEAELLEELVPFSLDSVNYNGSLRLVIIPDGPGFISSDRARMETAYDRARILCSPVIMPAGISIQVPEEVSL